MLYLYTNFTPNTDDLHYYFTTPLQYKNAIASHLIKSETLDNYRINTNVIKVTLDATLTEAIADTITYAIDERQDNGIVTYFRAYHVNRIIIQSGFATLYCSVDLWASYFYKASISNLNVNRCNRNIATGLLDDLAGTKGNATRTYCATTGTSGTNNELMERNRVYIVFALKYNIEQNNAGSVSRIGLFAFNIQDLVQRLYDAQPSGNNKIYYSMVNPIELATDVVAGIYGITGLNQWSITGTLNAVVLGAWFSDSVGVITNDNINIKSKPNWQNFTDITLTPYDVIKTEYTKEVTITNDFNKQFYVGTRQNGLKLQRTTEATISVFIKTIPSNDKLKVIAYQGDNQQDITDAFSVTIGTTDGDVTAERQALEIVQNSIKFIGAGLAVAKGVSGGEQLAGVIALQGATSTFAGNLERSQHIGSLINGGDGALSYYRVYTGTSAQPASENIATPVTNPYIINAFTSINDEQANVRLYGAKFNELTNFASVFSASLMGNGLSYTYLRASCNVDGIPTEASDAIKSKINNGIYIEDLTI